MALAGKATVAAPAWAQTSHTLARSLIRRLGFALEAPAGGVGVGAAGLTVADSSEGVAAVRSATTGGVAGCTARRVAMSSKFMGIRGYNGNTRHEVQLLHGNR